MRSILHFAPYRSDVAAITQQRIIVEHRHVDVRKIRITLGFVQPMERVVIQPFYYNIINVPANSKRLDHLIWSKQLLHQWNSLRALAI